MKYLGNTWTQEDLQGLRTIVVPSGIGEFQWAWTKYGNTGDRFAILGLDGAPRRLHQFCELHPAVAAFAYCGFDYSTIRGFQQMHGLDTWAAVTSQFGLDGSLCMLACNPHLEAGKPLATWMPDLPTTYRYPLTTTDAHRQVAAQYLRHTHPGDVLIGVSCASYRGAAAWKTWGDVEWTAFLRRVQQATPAARFVLLGGAWDDLTAAVFDEASRLRWLTDARGLPPIGRTTFGAAVELLKALHGYIGFSSGLGHVACHCCNCPTFMLWPGHEQRLSIAWVDPELLESGFYVPSSWLSPSEVFHRVKPWLSRLERKAYEPVCVL